MSTLPVNDNVRPPYRGPRVLCQAIVDPTHPGPTLGSKMWNVTVTGLAPFAETRRYVIPAKSDNVAAQQGIARFVAEMEARD